MKGRVPPSPLSARSFFRDPVGFVGRHGRDGADLSGDEEPPDLLRIAHDDEAARAPGHGSGVAAQTLERHRARRVELAA